MKQIFQIPVLLIFSLTYSLGAYGAGTNQEAPADGLPVSTHNAAKTGQGSNGSASQISQMIGQGLLATGTAMMPKCAAHHCGCCPTAAMLIAMGIQGLMQSAANKGTAGQHGYVAQLSDEGTGTKSGGYDTLGSIDNVPGFNASKLDDLKKYGVTYKDGKISLPNGKSFSLSDVSNPAAMANAGVSAGEYAKAMGQVAALEKKAGDAVEKVGAHTASQGFESGGGGSSSPVPSSSEEVSMGAAKAARDPAASVAGMTKSYNGEMIGVSGDSLFEMMARRYRQKFKEESFLPPESAPMSSN